MEEERIQGIVLRVFDYQENMRVMTLFSSAEGVVQVLVRGRWRRRALTTPLSEVEVLFRRGRSAWLVLTEGSVLEENLALRATYEGIKVAGEMAQLILSSQLQGKPAPLLYELFRAYLRQIPLCQDLFLILASFKLKLLIHEGVLSLAERCVRCGQRACHIHQGQSLCETHAAPEGIHLSVSEWEGLYALGHAKSFKHMSGLSIENSLLDKIAQMMEAANIK